MDYYSNKVKCRKIEGLMTRLNMLAEREVELVLISVLATKKS